MNRQPIYVTLTSYPKRINNLVVVLDSILRNSIKPNKIFLNLSIEEFPNKENDLPIGLQMFLKVNPIVFVNWVSGNTKAFKKIVPILKYLNDDDIIISMDDDFRMPEKLIENRLIDFSLYNRKHPITPNRRQFRNEIADINFYMSPTSIFTKKMFNNWEKWYIPEIIDLLEDDRVNTYIIRSNGYMFLPSTNLELVELVRRYRIDARVDKDSLSRLYSRNSTKILENKLNDILRYDVIQGSDQQITNFSNNKIVVYCYVTNNKLNKPWPKIFPTNNVDYVMFTDDVKDNEVERDGWRLVKIPARTFDYTYEDMNKKYKWNSANLFGDKYDYSIYIDSKVQICKDPNEIINEYKDKIIHGFITHRYDYQLPKHENNHLNVYKHADYLIDVKAGVKEKIIEWKRFLRNQKFPRGKPRILEGCVIISDLKNEGLKQLQKEIFEDYYNSGTLRDQLTIPYTLWKKDINIEEIYVMGDYLRSNRTNNHFHIFRTTESNNRTYKKPKVIVSLTSWPKRIDTCDLVIKSILNQTVKVDKIYLNLSVEEFLNKELDLPKKLLELKTNKSFIINWVDGVNTKTYKKVFSILEYLDDEDLILYTDDDILLPPDLLRSRIDDFYIHNEKYAITSSTKNRPSRNLVAKISRRYNLDILDMPGPNTVTLISKKMFNNFDKLLSNEFIKETCLKNLCLDDVIYTYLLLLNGYKFGTCSRFPMNYTNIKEEDRKLEPLTFFIENDSLKHIQPIPGDYKKSVDLVIELIEKQLMKIKNKKYFENMSLFNHVLYFGDSKKRIWLFEDRYDLADDNAEHLYRYVKENLKTNKLHLYYLLDRNSIHYNRLKNEGFNLLSLNDAEKYVDKSDLYICSNNRHGNFFNKRNMPNTKFVYLSHGYFNNKIDAYKRDLGDNFNYFILRSDKELEALDFVKNTDKYLIAGNSRYDKLKEFNRFNNRNILFCLTWRQHISFYDNSNFVKTDYFKNSYELLKSNKFNDLLRSYNFKCIFHAHPRMRKFLHLYKLSNNIILPDVNDLYSDVFISSDCLITDYSSIAFDFAYMEKPVLYFQPDIESFKQQKSGHTYSRMLFNYECSGFGPVSYNGETLINNLEKTLQNNCVLGESYKTNAINAFKYHDSNNSKRIFDFLLTL